MLSIYNSGAEKFNSVLGQMQGSTGATEAAFGKMTDTTEYAKKRLANATENMKIAIGDKLTPALKVYEAGAGAFEWATKFVEEHPDVVAAVTGLTAALAALAACTVGITMVGTAIEALNRVLRANPWTLLVTSVVAAIAGFTAFAAVTENAVDAACRETDEFIESSKELTDSIKENKEAYESSAKETERSYGAYRKTAEALEKLSKKENKSAEDKARMKYYVDELNSAMPGLNLQFDEQTGAIDKTSAAVENYIASM